MINSKNILITGANSYLGGWVVDELGRAGHKLNLMNSNGEMVSLLSFPPEKVEVVIHLGWANGQEPEENKELQKYHLDRTRILADLMYKFQPQFIFASSARVYGDKGSTPCDEKTTKLNPNCYYSQSKAFSEKHIHAYLRRHLFLRLGTLMGLGNGRTRLDTTLNAYSYNAWKRSIVEVTDPDCWESYLHVRDAALIIKVAIEKRWVGVCNVAQNAMTRIELAEQINRLGNAETRISSGEKSTSCRLDCKRLRRFLPRGFVMRTIPETINEFRGYEEKAIDRFVPASNRKLLTVY